MWFYANHSYKINCFKCPKNKLSQMLLSTLHIQKLSNSFQLRFKNEKLLYILQ